MVKRFCRDGNVMVTSYGTFVINQKEITDKPWHYVILDEGHKIRNPDAQVFLLAFVSYDLCAIVCSFC